MFGVNLNKEVLLTFSFVFFVFISVVRTEDEFHKGKLTSGQVRNKHRYHHILVEPEKEGKSTRDEPYQHYDWFTSSRGEFKIHLTIVKIKVKSNIVFFNICLTSF